MTKDEINKGNDLIAEFMMRKDHINNVEGFYMDHPIIEWHSRGANDSEFHSSWDWLMPVVIKIAEECAVFKLSFQKFDNKWGIIVVSSTAGMASEIGSPHLTPETLWISVVMYIKEYNKNKK